MKNLFTSESVSEGHPDKLSDQISDRLLDNLLAFDSDSKVAIETFVTTDRVIIGGEINTSSDIDYLNIVRDVIKDIGYDKDCLLYTSPSPRDVEESRMPSSA